MRAAGRPRRVRHITVILSTVLATVVSVGAGFSTMQLRPLTAAAEEMPSEANVQPTLTLAPTTPVFVPGDASAEFSLELSNTSQTSFPKSRAALFISAQRITSQTELATALSVDALPGDISIALASAGLAETDSGDARTATFTVETTRLPAAASQAPGVYVAYATVTSDSEAAKGSLLVATPFVWQGTGSPSKTPLHTIVPLMLPASIDGMPSANELGELTAAGGLLTENFATAQARTSTLAIDPRIVVAIRALGERAPASATQFLERLSATTNPTFALQYADADLAAQGQMGLPAPLEPLGVSFVARNTPAADFAAFNYSIPAVAWPRQASVSEQSLSFMRQHGYATVLLSENNLVMDNGSSGLLDQTRVVSVNDACTRLSGTIVSNASASSRQSATAQLVAELALHNQSPSAATPVTCAIDRAQASNRDVAPALNAISDLPWVQTTNFSSVVQQSAAVTLASTPLPIERIESLRAALANEPLVDTYSAVLQRPEFLQELQRMRILEFFATSIGVGSPNYEGVSQQFFERDEKTLRAVHVTPAKETNLVGSSSRIPIQVSNELPFTASVSAAIEAANFGLSITEPEVPATRIEKNSSVNLTIPVEARVSAGKSALIVTLFAENDLVIDEEVLPINIRSSWEAIALVTLGVLVAAFFGFGIWRSIRVRRAEGFPSDSRANAP